MNMSLRRIVVLSAVSVVSSAGLSGHARAADNAPVVQKDGLTVVQSEVAPAPAAVTPTSDATSRVVTAAVADQYFSIGAEAFFPGSTARYSNSYGMGGAYFLDAVNGALVAHVHLPHNAIIRELKVFFNDNSSKDLSVSLMGLQLVSGAFLPLATVTSTGVGGYGSKSTTSISYSTVNNTSLGYLIYAWCAPWDNSGNLRIMGAMIRYTPAP